MLPNQNCLRLPLRVIREMLQAFIQTVHNHLQMGFKGRGHAPVLLRANGTAKGLDGLEKYGQGFQVLLGKLGFQTRPRSAQAKSKPRTCERTDESERVRESTEPW